MEHPNGTEPKILGGGGAGNQVLNWPIPPSLTQGLVRGEEGISLVAGLVVAPGPGSKL